jgi:hypothetical protein
MKTIYKYEISGDSIEKDLGDDFTYKKYVGYIRDSNQLVYHLFELY